LRAVGAAAGARRRDDVKLAADRAVDGVGGKDGVVEGGVALRGEGDIVGSGAGGNIAVGEDLYGQLFRVGPIRAICEPVVPVLPYVRLIEPIKFTNEVVKLLPESDTVLKRNFG
jgi:hypothetical protein